MSSSFLSFIFSVVVVDCICSVTLQLYSPKRPAVDVAEVFLWLMAVGTILCASYWSAWTAREEAIEQDKLLKVLTRICIYLKILPFGCQGKWKSFRSDIVL